MLAGLMGGARTRSRFEVIGVVGAGTMGAGIAQLALEAGHEVLIHDVDPDAVGRARARIADGLARRVAKRGLADDAAAEATGAMLERLHDAVSLGELSVGSDLVIEAALEDLDLKRVVFGALDEAALAHVPLASNTSALSIDAIARDVQHPERVLGLHFFNPAPLMPLVEVVSGPRTSHAAAASLAALMSAWGKQPVRCHDAPGFIVNRVNRPYPLEALRILAAGRADIATIDAAMRSEGFPLGPFEYMDFVGLDVNLAASRALFDAFGHARFRPAALQERLVAEGRLGRKSGRGFYLCGSDGAPAGPDHDLEPGLSRTPLGPDGIAERITLGIVNEAFHALDDGVADEATIDLALKLGAAHPVGPFERARAIGFDELAATLDSLSTEEGDAFRPAIGLLHAVARARSAAMPRRPPGEAASEAGPGEVLDRIGRAAGAGRAAGST